MKFRAVPKGFGAARVFMDRFLKFTFWIVPFLDRADSWLVRIRPGFLWMQLSAAPPAAIFLLATREIWKRESFKETDGFLKNPSLLPTAEMIWL